MRQVLIGITGVCVFAVAATLNAGGYGYGVADQAIYLPSVLDRLTPELYPRDGSLLQAQQRFTAFDEAVAATARTVGGDLTILFFVLYAAGLATYAAGIILVGRALYHSWWTIAALGLALTLRHRIPETAVNTLEGYLHPRTLVFALGVAGLGCLLHGRRGLAFVLIAASALIHPNTAVWFAVWIGVAAAVEDVRLRRPALLVASAALALAAWALTMGPLAAGMRVMDPTWIALLEAKDYLFADEWPLWAWLVNLGYGVLIVMIYRWRAARGLLRRGETGLVAGALVLFAAFLLTFPLVVWRFAFVVQLQVSRVFWMLDFWATTYFVWAVVEGIGLRSRGAPKTWLPATVVLVLAACSLGRGLYVIHTDASGRAVVELSLPSSDWSRVMAWLKRTPEDTNLLVDPAHAWRYGTSARIASERDVLLEEVKDTAVAIYSRDVADRVLDRIEAIGDFDDLTATRARMLANRYDLDYLVTEDELALPLVHREGRFQIYRLQE